MWNYLIINGTKILPLVQEFLNEKIDLPYCFKHTSCGDLNVVFESKGHADFFKYQWEKYNMGQVSGEYKKNMEYLNMNVIVREKGE